MRDSFDLFDEIGWHLFLDVGLFNKSVATRFVRKIFIFDSGRHKKTTNHKVEVVKS